MLNQQNFIDPQGQSFTSAVVRVMNARYTRNIRQDSNEQLRMDQSDFSLPSNTTSDTTDGDRQELFITYAYWPTQEDYDAGKQPYQLTNTQNNTFRFELFNEELSKTKYDGLSLEGKCELYFSDEILPTLV